MGSIASNLSLSEKHCYPSDVELFKETQKQDALAEEYREKGIKSFKLYLNLSFSYLKIKRYELSIMYLDLYFELASKKNAIHFNTKNNAFYYFIKSSINIFYYSNYDLIIIEKSIKLYQKISKKNIVTNF